MAIPNLSSPKFPQPIFLPTLKFGPTMNILDDEAVCCLGCILLEGRLPRLDSSPERGRSPAFALLMRTKISNVQIESKISWGNSLRRIHIIVRLVDYCQFFPSESLIIFQSLWTLCTLQTRYICSL